MRFRAVLFDLDCTLTDRRLSVYAAADLFCRTYKPPCDPDDLGQIMIPADRFGYRDRREFFAEIVDLIRWKGHPPIEEFVRFWSEDAPTCAMPARDARELLVDLRKKGMRLAIVTNGDVTTQAGKIRQLRFAELVDSVVISGAIGICKPDRRIFEQTLLRLGTEPRDAVFVGDHPVNDVAGAQAAGIRAVWVTGACDYPANIEKPWKTIGQVNELWAILDERSVRVVA